MRGAYRICLLLAVAGLFGMAAAPPEAGKKPLKGGAGQAEDAALIAGLDQWEEQAAAEKYEFFLAMDRVLEAGPEKPGANEEEAK